MSSDQNNKPTMSAEDEDLLHTQNIRRELIRRVSNDGGKLPDEKADKAMLIQLLDGMDRQALSKLRIKSDEGTADKQSAAAATIAHLIATGSIINRHDRGHGTIPTLDDNLPPPTLVEGELETPQGTNASNASNLDYDSFTAGRNTL